LFDFISLFPGLAGVSGSARWISVKDPRLGQRHAQVRALRLLALHTQNNGPITAHNSIYLIRN